MGRSSRQNASQSPLRINWQEPRLIVLVGLPGSGKSTWARKMAGEHGCCVVSADEVRLELWGDLQGAQEKEKHEEVFRIVHQRLLQALRGGQVAVADATNIYEHARESLYQLAQKAGVPVEIVFFADHRRAAERNSLRSGGERVPDRAMERMEQAIGKVSFPGDTTVYQLI